MTRKEAIAYFEEKAKIMEQPPIHLGSAVAVVEWAERCDRMTEAFGMAIAALKEQEEYEILKNSYHQLQEIFDRTYASNMAMGEALRERKNPCDLCRYNPPSSCDGKPCTMCPASSKEEAHD